MLSLKVDRLLKDELIFELKIRNISFEVNTPNKELIKLLREAINLEKAGRSFKSEINLIVPDELKIIGDKLTTIEPLFKEPVTSTLLRKIETKLCHLLNRIEHLVPIEPQHIQERSTLLARLLTFVSDFNDLKTRDPCDDLPELSFSNSQNQPPSTSTPHQTNVNLNVKTSTEENLAKALEVLCLTAHSSSIRDSGIKFTGEPNTLGVNAFLERILEIKEARGLTEEQLFKTVSDLFEGKALVWFRSMKHIIKDWSTLCAYLKDEFLPSDYNDRLWEIIKKRTQGETESISIYVAYMSNLFSRLTVPVSDSAKLKIIRKNLLPYYQEKIILLEIDTLDSLIKFGKKLEECKVNIQKFLPPITSDLLEHDLSYQPVVKSRHNSRISFLESQTPCNKNSRECRHNCQRVNTHSQINSSENETRLGHRSRSNCRSDERSLSNSSYRNRNYSGRERSNSRASHSRDRSNSRIRNFRDRSISANRSQPTNSSIQCSKCNSTQHVSQNCSIKTCFKCNSTEHFARSCPSKIIKCYSCGKLGYTTKTCPICSKNMSRR